jgi:hypothetical protein
MRHLPLPAPGLCLGRGRAKLPCGFQFQDLQSHGCNLVSVTAVHQPPSSDHLMSSLLATNRMAAAGVVEPASSVDKVSI